jgi:hypothetical protein
MSDDLGNLGEPVAEVDPDDLRPFGRRYATFKQDIPVSILVSLLK